MYSILNAGFLGFTMWANLMSFYKTTTKVILKYKIVHIQTGVYGV
jgi:hypothetical protein